MVDVIILNGGSSSGKTTLAKHLQNSLSAPWLRFSIDDLVDALPHAMVDENGGITFGSDGSVMSEDKLLMLPSPSCRPDVQDYQGNNT